MGLTSGERVALVNCLETAWRLFAATGQVNFYLLYKELEKEGGGGEVAGVDYQDEAWDGE
ncbi:MAG: YqzL family protein [Clostridia bacterium]|nr:YqzL family protein [Clostridia bacterium]